jgi:hypothetical protein
LATRARQQRTPGCHSGNGHSSFASMHDNVPLGRLVLRGVAVFSALARRLQFVRASLDPPIGSSVALTMNMNLHPLLGQKKKRRVSVVATVGMTVGTLFVSLAGACGPMLTHNLGDKCWLDYECAEPLACVANACHHACSTTSDCPDKAACITIQNRGVCRLSRDCADSQDCPSGIACVANQCVGASDDAGDSSQDLDSEAAAAEAAVADAGSQDALDAASNDSATCDAAAPMPFDFKPSNFSPVGLGWDAAPIAKITSPDCDERCLPPPVANFTTENGVSADLYVLESLSIDATAALTLRGSRPVVFAVADTVEIAGKLIVAAAGPLGGPGGYASGTVPGPGAGETAVSSGGGGGSYCLLKDGGGGWGGTLSGSGAAPGKEYGRPELIPLVGGSAGGDGSDGAPGGAGGGAVQIVAGSSVTVPLFGSIHAGGGEGAGATRASGGGSGGAILLEAPSVVINGHVAANGGGGGQGSPNGERGSPASDDDRPAPGGGSQTADGGHSDGEGGSGSAANSAAKNGLPAANGTAGGGGGGGGPGRIRINTKSGRATVGGILSPNLVSPCASQGVVSAWDCPASKGP